jgi:hypothetical protein
MFACHKDSSQVLELSQLGHKMKTVHFLIFGNTKGKRKRFVTSNVLIKIHYFLMVVLDDGIKRVLLLLLLLKLATPMMCASC